MVYLLSDEVGGRLGQDPVQVVLRQALELHADRQAPLELGQQVRRLAGVERARGNEQNVVRVHVPWE